MKEGWGEGRNDIKNLVVFVNNKIPSVTFNINFTRYYSFFVLSFVPKGKGGCAGLVHQAVVDGLNKAKEQENAEEKKSQSAAIKMTCSTDGGYRRLSV